MAELRVPMRSVLAWRPRSLAPWLLMALMAAMVVYPIGMLLYGSVRDAPPGFPGGYTLRWYTQAFSEPAVLRAIMNTLIVSVPRVLLAIALATSFAWIIARTDTPYRRLLEALMVFMFFLPNLPWIISWVLLASPRTGFLNQFLFSHLPGGFRMDVFSYAGIIILGAVRIAPVIYLFIAPAFKAMDASLEESSRMSGASAWRTIFKIDIPLMAPAILTQAIAALILTLESFELEFLLGTPAGIWVYTTRIYEFIYETVPPSYGPATALSMTLMLLTFALVNLQWRLLGKRHFTVVTGRGYQARPYPLGRWRWVAFSFIFGFFLVFVLLPFAILLANSFTFVAGFYGWEYFTLKPWREAFTIRSSQLFLALRNTIAMGVVAATAGIVLYAVVSYIVARTRWAGRRAMDLLAWTPLTIPGIVIALGYFWAIIFIPGPLNMYGTIWVLMLVFIARGFPIGTRILTPTMMQVGAELEECSRIHGASWLRTFRSIWFPLLKPAFLSGWIVLFVVAVRNLDTVLFLYGPGSTVLSTEIFKLTTSGQPNAALVLSLLQTGLIVAAFGVATLLAPRQKMS